ncbi:MAG: type II toxin-antitoxin system YafQ family toxin [Lachnospiraceae bacterium]
MKYTIKRSRKFKRNYKLAQKRGLDTSLLKDIILKLGNGVPLEEKYQDHSLKGNWEGLKVGNRK